MLRKLTFDNGEQATVEAELHETRAGYEVIDSTYLGFNHPGKAYFLVELPQKEKGLLVLMVPLNDKGHPDLHDSVNHRRFRTSIRVKEIEEIPV